MRHRLLLAAAATLLSAHASSACDLGAKTALLAGSGCAVQWMDANLRLNDLQTVGTHNSYKGAIPLKLLAMIRARSPDGAIALDYSHPALKIQLDEGERGLELDVAYDPKGGRYAHPMGLPLSGVPAPEGFADAMAAPGFKVLHIQEIDFRSTCLTFKGCLAEIKAWSDAHPRHAPILITMNAKDDASPVPGGVDALKFDVAAFDALDAEIRSVIPKGQLITPDDVQGAYPTLRAAVLAGNWPTLGASRGKILFALDEDEAKVAMYRGARKSLEGRAVFINTDEASPAAAYLTLNEAQTDSARIAKDVALGYLVRTRADADTKEARSLDVARRDLAFASGAQVVSTDYPTPEPRFGAYAVTLPGGAAVICNPRRAPERCAGRAVESKAP